MNDFATFSIIAAANVIAAAEAVVTDGNPFLNFVQNGASVAAIMSVFLWREIKRSERYEKLYDEERKTRLNMCSSCPFQKEANKQFLEDHNHDEN